MCYHFFLHPCATSCSDFWLMRKKRSWYERTPRSVNVTVPLAWIIFNILTAPNQATCAAESSDVCCPAFCGQRWHLERSDLIFCLFQKNVFSKIRPMSLSEATLGAPAPCPNLKLCAMGDGWLLGVPGTQRGRGNLLEGLWPRGSETFGRDLSRSRSRRARLCH